MDNPYASPSTDGNSEPTVDRNAQAGFGFVARSVLLILAATLFLYFAWMTGAWTHLWMTRTAGPDANEKAMYVGAIAGTLASGAMFVGGILNNRRLSLTSAFATIVAFAAILLFETMR